MRLVQLSVGGRLPVEGLPAGTDRHAATDAAGVDAALAELEDTWPG